MFDPSKETFFEKVFKVVDLFGKPVEFTIGDKKTFKTALGGISTLLCFTVLGIYFVIKCI